MATTSLPWRGILEAVMETHVPESTLIHKHKSGRVFLTTAHLSKLIQDWLSRINATPIELHAPWLEKVNRNLAHAHSLMMAFTTSRFQVFRPLGDGLPAMLCFIAIIGEALVNAKMAFKAAHLPQGFSWSMIWTAEHRDMLRAEMLADGWCPITIEYLTNTTNVSSLKHALESEPPVDGKYHGNCTDTSCAAYVVDTESYKPRHVAGCVEELSPSARDYSSSGLARRSTLDRQPLHPEQQRRTQQGNQDDGADLHEAAAVLVLDAGLQHCDSTNPSGIKILHVLTSGWMRPFWTLQEAVLAKAICIMFADGVLIDLATLIPPTQTMLLSPAPNRPSSRALPAQQALQVRRLQAGRRGAIAALEEH
ncbi:hypothetical protein B0T17DRAFT_611707 [Bombardia bombarda]|uniref:Uncharacterized protein n=1 Tax=Bombardia bombarda TaxID=252184 RepID=A0AA39XKH7_9PEZI|nr:hypothetical protein B0T17DRAFT_611707 [Bombardia bombarda]